MLELNWIRCDGGREWCPFQDVNLPDPGPFGVYVIFRQRPAGGTGLARALILNQAVRVG